MIRILLIAAITVALSACGSAPPRQPVAIEQAQKTALSAHRAMREGDLYRARELFKQAMLMQQALENIPDRSLNTLNLASVQHRMGQDEVALQLLDGLLNDPAQLIPVDLQAAAAFRKAIILVDLGRNNESATAVQVSQNLCAKTCAIQPGLNNLQARLLLDGGNKVSALEIVKQVISANPEKVELANAQRLAGKIENMLEQYDAALAHYSSALELDKELAFSKRIAEDLHGMASALSGLKRDAEAALYQQRAEAVTAASSLLNK